jgi:hypothetical protein
MQTTFLFIDDSYNEETDFPLSSLTGLLVPASNYRGVRAAFYEVIGEKTKVLNPNLPELHFQDFMPHLKDEEKFQILRSLVRLVISEKLQVLRVGYYVTEFLRETFKGDRNLIGLCWMGLMSALGPILQQRLVVPVLDAGFNESFQPIVRQFSSLGRNTDLMRAAGLEKMISLPKSENLGEVVYGDSRYSAFIQLTDTVAGLRRVSETVRETGRQPRSEYKVHLLEISKEIEPAILEEHAIALRYNGEIHGPKHAAG